MGGGSFPNSFRYTRAAIMAPVWNAPSEFMAKVLAIRLKDSEIVGKIIPPVAVLVMNNL